MSSALELISAYDFNYYPDLKEPYMIYPSLKDSSFNMSLQTDDEFLTARVRYDFVFKGICIEIYNEQGELIQPRIRAIPNLNLLYLIGYSLFWEQDKARFAFYKGMQ